VNAARFAHCQPRRPVAYRSKSPFRPVVAAPLDFSDRVGQVYTLDHELDRAVLQTSDYAALLEEDSERSPGPGRVFRPDPALGSAASVPRPKHGIPPGLAARRRFACNEVRFSMEAARFRPPWTVALFKEAHASLLDGLGTPGTPGELRTEPFLAADTDGVEWFRACPPDQIAADLAAVLDWVDLAGATYHPLIPATVLFQSIYSIRPFPVGNVTLARTMATLYLRLFGLPNVSLTPLARVGYASQELSVRLLLWTEATGSYLELLDHSLDSVLESYAQANSRWLAVPHSPGRLEEAALRVLARARRDPGWFSTREATTWVGARSDQTILRHLNDMVRRGLLESLGKTRSKRFRLAPPPSLLPGLTSAVDPPARGATAKAPRNRPARESPPARDPRV
jgi:Fic family protein